MRFSEYLRTTVMLLSTTSIALLLIAVSAIARESSATLMVFTIAWTIAAVAIGLWIGRGGAAMESIRALLSRSRPEPVFPRIEPGAVLLTRLWPVLLLAIAAAVASIWFPSPAIATSGYGLIWALSWRKQALAVEAIEERDAVHFWIVRTSVFSRPKLVRVPAM